jgi:hypothetical protein
VVSHALVNGLPILERIQNALRVGKQPDTAVAVEVLQDIYGEGDDILVTAYVMFSKALEPRSAFDLGELLEPRWLPPETPLGPSPYGDDPDQGGVLNLRSVMTYEPTSHSAAGDLGPCLSEEGQVSFPRQDPFSPQVVVPRYRPSPSGSILPRAEPPC